MDYLEIEEILEDILNGDCEVALGKLGAYSLNLNISEIERNIIKQLELMSEAVIIYMGMTEEFQNLKEENCSMPRFIKQYLN
jgi:uncharacterized protein Yka (UPF0111/DUF47 family)